MKKVGIIRCQQTEDMCPGNTDFKVAKEGKLAFEETGPAEVSVFSIEELIQSIKDNREEDGSFTRDFFLSKLSQLREHMGSRSFWKEDTPKRAMSQLMYVYSRVNDLTEQDIDLFVATVDEFDMRLGMVIGSGLYQRRAVS